MDRKSVNQKSLLFELAVTKFRKAIKQGRERDQQCPRRWIEEYKNVDITGGEWLTMETGSRCSTECIARNNAFV